jgi:nucleotide-binding universal stress UspA family protein
MPFALGGHFHMLDYHWHVTGGPLRLVMPGHSFGWPERALQAAVTLAIAGLLARRVRSVGAAVFIVPAAAAIVRLSIDPMGTYYYWDAPLTIELVGAAAALANLDAIRAWVELRVGRVAATPV